MWSYETFYHQKRLTAASTSPAAWHYQSKSRSRSRHEAQECVLRPQTYQLTWPHADTQLWLSYTLLPYARPDTLQTSESAGARNDNHRIRWNRIQSRSLCSFSLQRLQQFRDQRSNGTHTCWPPTAVSVCVCVWERGGWVVRWSTVSLRDRLRESKLWPSHLKHCCWTQALIILWSFMVL